MDKIQVTTDIPVEEYNQKDLLRGKKIKSFDLDIRVGKSFLFKEKLYQVTGAILYEGKRYERNTSGKLRYIEWILQDANKNPCYISESKSNWSEDGETGVEYESEFSTPITTPPFEIFAHHIEQSSEQNLILTLEHNVEKIVPEYDRCKVLGLHGLASSEYDLQEELITAYISHEGTNYAIDIETFDGKTNYYWFSVEHGPESETQQTTSHVRKRVVGITSMIISFFSASFMIPSGEKEINVFQLGRESQIEIGKSYYFPGNYTINAGAETCSDDGDTWSCYKYKDYHGFAFTITDNTDKELLENIVTKGLSYENTAAFVDRGKLIELSSDEIQKKERQLFFSDWWWIPFALLFFYLCIKFDD